MLFTLLSHVKKNIKLGIKDLLISIEIVIDKLYDWYKLCLNDRRHALPVTYTGRSDWQMGKVRHTRTAW